MDYETQWARQQKPRLELYIENAKKKYYEDIKMYEVESDLSYKIENIIDSINMSLNDINDRRQIYSDIVNEIPGAIDSNFNLHALFYHVDNIRYIYSEYKKDPPQWYTHKYGKFYAR
jgi:hypothetical protein